MNRGRQVRAAGQAARSDAASVAGPAQQRRERRSPDAVDPTRVRLLLERLRRSLGQLCARDDLRRRGSGGRPLLRAGRSLRATL